MDLADFLATSAATDAFKADLIAFAEHEPAPRIQSARHVPRIKILRVVTQLLHAEPGLEVDAVTVDGHSGCSDFKGTVTVVAGGETIVFEFVWDCQWRAMQQGWVDHFGLPDQIRAAREFGWRCFEQWRRAGTASASGRRAQVRSH
jgi:hypothetical protein